MTRKKLDFMNVKGEELTREELSNIMAGCGGSKSTNSTCYCSTDQCVVGFVQYYNPDRWRYSVYCGEVGGSSQTYNGQGIYQGTLCNGECPNF